MFTILEKLGYLIHINNLYFNLSKTFYIKYIWGHETGYKKRCICNMMTKIDSLIVSVAKEMFLALCLNITDIKAILLVIW